MDRQLQLGLPLPSLKVIHNIPHFRTVFLVIGTWVLNGLTQMSVHFSVNDVFTVIGSILTSAVSGYALYDIHLKVKWKHKRNREEQEAQEKEERENETGTDEKVN